MIKLLLTLSVLLFSGSIAADVYKWVDKEGNVHYGDEHQADINTAEKVDATPTNNYSAQEAMPQEMKQFLNDRTQEKQAQDREEKARAQDRKVKSEKEAAKKKAADEAAEKERLEFRKRYLGY